MNTLDRIPTQRPSLAPPVDHSASTDAAARTAGVPDAHAEAERAAAHVSALRPTVRGSRSARLDRAMRRLVRNYQNQPSDRAGMIALLRNPEVGRAVAGASEEEIDASLARVDGGILQIFERMSVKGALRESFDSAIRGDIVRTGTERIHQHMASLRRLQDRILENLPEFQRAQPGTPEFAVAREFGILDDPGDAERVREHIGEAQDGLDEMQSWLQGQTWENGDLERSGIAAAARRGWHMTSADAFIEHSLVGKHSAEVAAHVVLDTAEYMHLGYESVVAVSEGVEGGTLAAATPALAGLAVGAAGLAFGLYIHHLGEEQQAEHIAAAQELGL